jgi:hypothetical protein
MKRFRIWIITLIIVAMVSVASALNADTGKGFTLRASYFSPSDAQAGFAFGGSYGYMFDRFVELGVGADFLYKTYRESTPVATEEFESGLNSTTVVNRVQYNRLIIPILAELTVKFPVFWKASIFGQGGIGYELLWNKEENFEPGVSRSDSRLYGGFTYQFGAGLLIGLGRDSALFAEGYYNHAVVKRSREDIVKDLPVFEEVDLSGFGARVGIALGPF